MRTKTLLIAAAALAAAVTSSNAQSTVYSQNIVGYVNTVIPGGSAYSMICNPLNGTTNAADALMPALQGGENLLIWHGTGYYTYTYTSPGFGTGLGYQSDWIDGGATPPQPPTIPGDQTDASDGLYFTPRPILTPGQGCFLQNPNGAETNTFTGTALTTNSVVIAGGSAYSMLASTIPVGGGIQTNAAINITQNFAGGENVLLWNGSGYYVYTFTSPGFGTGLGYQSDWIDGSATPPAPPTIPGDQTDASDGLYFAPEPAVKVGQGFFIQNPNGAETWSQNINVQ